MLFRAASRSISNRIAWRKSRLSVGGRIETIGNVRCQLDGELAIVVFGAPSMIGIDFGSTRTVKWMSPASRALTRAAESPMPKLSTSST